MPHQIDLLQDALTKALLGSALYSVLLSPVSVQPPSAWVLQPRLDKKLEYIRTVRSLENPCFDQAGAISILKSKSDAQEADRVKTEFYTLARAWKSDRRATSSSTSIAMHPAYQKIIGLGKPALPFILSELERDVDHWFWALASIANENPVPLQTRGKMQEMAKVWIGWGRSKGYIK
jgi:hypothetical protein